MARPCRTERAQVTADWCGSSITSQLFADLGRTSEAVRQLLAHEGSQSLFTGDMPSPRGRAEDEAVTTPLEVLYDQDQGNCS